MLFEMKDVTLIYDQSVFDLEKLGTDKTEGGTTC